MKVIALVAHTLDGFIARGSDELVDWSSKEDKKLFAEVTKQAGVVVMGMNTFKTIGRPLPNRLNVVLTSRASELESVESIIKYKNITAAELLKELKDYGFETVFVIGGASIYSQFLEAKLLDELWVTIEPVLFGQGLANFKNRVEGITGKLLEMTKLNENTVHLKYALEYQE